MSMCRVISCVVEKGCLLWPVCSLNKIVSLCLASFCTPRPNLPVTPGISLPPNFVNKIIYTNFSWLPTWGNRQIWPWNMEWSRAKANRVLPRECIGHSKHPLPTTHEMTLHMDITRWLIMKSDWLYSLQLTMKKLHTVSKNTLELTRVQIESEKWKWS